MIAEGDALEKIRVVIVEDHAVVRDGTRLILEAEEDIEVVAEASDGEDAVNLCAKLKPDVVLLDIKLQGMNGLEAAKRISVASPETAILVLSAYDYEQYVKAMLRAGAKGYILKSASGREVVEAVRLIHAGGAPFSAAIASKMFEELSKNENPIRIRKPSLEDLSDREFQVLYLLSKGARNTQIAEELGISVSTVETHVKKIYTKLGAKSRGEAVANARHRGLLDVDELMEFT